MFKPKLITNLRIFSIKFETLPDIIYPIVGYFHVRDKYIPEQIDYAINDYGYRIEYGR